MKKTTLAAVLGAVMLTGTASADMGIGIVGGTVGAGAYLGFKYNDMISFRIQGTKWNLTDTRNIDNIDYDVSLDVGAVGAYVDLFPFSGTFHISAGLTKSLTELNITNASAGAYQIGNNTYTIAPGQLRGKASFNTAPYLGIGWGQTVPKGWGMRFDLGAHFLGKADVSLYAPGVSSADLRAEEQKARNDIGDVIYPEVSLAVSYGW